VKQQPDGVHDGGAGEFGGEGRDGAGGLDAGAQVSQHRVVAAGAVQPPYRVHGGGAHRARQASFPGGNDYHFC
jgi:hypothetical protein